MRQETGKKRKGVALGVSIYTPVTEPNDQQKRIVEADRRSKCVFHFGLRS
jgi:hypothetical protein